MSGPAASPSRQDVLDILTDAISDSLDLDWQPSWAAAAALDALIEEGLMNIEPDPTQQKGASA